MSSTLLDSCWNALRLLARIVKEWSRPIEFCSLRIGVHTAVNINAMVDPHAECCYPVTLLITPGNHDVPHAGGHPGTCLRVDGLIRIVELTAGELPTDVRRMIDVYAPYCLAAMYARHWQRTFVVSHFAQSLDGRIATVSGDSKGISAELRRLTVRRVMGQNPTRFVVGSTIDTTESLTQASPDPVFLLGTRTSASHDGVDIIPLQRNQGFISSLQILEVMYQRGIHSVYIEGGATTTSRFLQERCVDVVQLHISPMIIGSGVPAFSMPEIQSV